MRGSRALISKGLLLAVFCTLWVGMAAAQYGSVKGTARDAQGTPIVGAQIGRRNGAEGTDFQTVRCSFSIQDQETPKPHWTSDNAQ